MIAMVNKSKKERALKIIAGQAVGNMGFFLLDTERDFAEAEKIRLATERAEKFLSENE